MEPKIKTCFDCEKEFADCGQYYSHQCPECLAASKNLKLEESRRKNRERLESSIPLLFRKTDTNHPKFNQTAWSAIQNHRLTEERPWLGLVGMTGRCKTRMGYLFAVEEIQRLAVVHSGEREQFPTYEFVASYQIGDAVIGQYSNDFETKSSSRDFLDRIRQCEVLLVDDICKGRLSPAIASELFSVVDHRQAHLLRTIWSSNGKPEVIAAGLGEDMSGPFAGRLIDMSRIFTFK